MNAKRAMVVVVALLAVASPLAGAQSRGATASDSSGGDATKAHPTDKAGGAISGGVPRMSGITPSRAELPASAFTKLDAMQRGYVTREDVRQLEGFEAAFRAGDQNGDGRLTPSEFNAAWGVYSGSLR